MTLPFRKPRPTPDLAPPVVERSVPLGCRSGLWHRWARWTLAARVETVQEGAKIVGRTTVRRHVRSCTACGLTQERL